jgi:hypothetical protein
LTSRCVGAGVGIIRLAGTPAPVGAVGRSTAGVRPGVRIVGSTGGGPRIRAVNSARNSVGAAICIVVRTYAVGNRVGAIDRISTNRIAIVRRVVITGAAGQDRSRSRARDERSEVSRGVARLDGTFGTRALGNIGYIINR